MKINKTLTHFLLRKKGWYYTLTILLLSTFNISKAQTVTVGTGTLTDTHCPIYSYYGYNYSQTIYLASELTSAGATGPSFISSISYYYNTPSTPETTWDHWDIYMKNSSKSIFSTNNNWDNGLSQVFSGTINIPATGGQWITINLDTPFLWDGTSNLVVGVNENSPGYSGSPGAEFQVTTLGSPTDYRTLLYYEDPNNPNPLAPPNANYSINSFANAMFELTPASVCSGAPANAFAISSNTLVCANTSFNLGLTNGTLATGLTYQWQSSPDGSSWTNLGSIQSAVNYSIANIADTTYYRCITTCTASALSATSTPIVVNLNPLLNCYCIPSYSWDCSGDKFWDFSLANITNQSNNCDVGGFSDWTTVGFTDVNLNAGGIYTLSVNTSNSGNGGNSAMGAWIDYDQNGVFDTNEFTNLGFGPAGSYSNTLTVPITAATGSVRMRLKLDASSANATTVISACDNNNFSNYGQILDYKVNITAAPACSGAPNAGNATSTETAICQNQSFTLDLTNNSVASSISYQWQSSTDNVIWSNLGVVQNTIPYSISTQSVTTYYRCITTCTISALSGTSTPIMVTQKAVTACYCTPQSVSCTLGGITNVLFETLNDAPVCNGTTGYTDNSTLTPVPLNANQSYTISLDINSQSGTGYVGLWIDYNQDGIFDANEYTHAGSANFGNLTTTVNVPFTAVGGTTRMRVRLESSWGYTPILFPCTNSNPDGQVIDYNVTITPVTPCTGAPNPGDATSSVSSICENIPFTLNLTNNDIVGNMSYQWQSSTDNVNWTNLGSSQSYVPYSVLSQSVTNYYRCLTTCTTSAQTTTSTVWTITQNAITTCYCIPDPMDCTGSDLINYVAFATMTNTSSCGTDGYSDFTGTVPSATTTAGQTYTITTVLGYMYGEHTHAWIDYNKNGVFDSSEYTDLGTNNGNDTISYAITIPVTAIPGTTRMRVRNIYGNSLGASDACFTPTFMPRSASLIMPSGTSGESEDYLVTILPPDCSIINFPPTVSVSGNFDICPGNSTTLDLTNPLPIATGITYQWKVFNGSSYVNEGTASSSSSLIASPTANTPYYCEILCNGTPVRNTDTVFVKVQTITTSPVTTNVTCNGLCNGNATINASSFGATLSYAWTSSVSTNDVASNLCAGLYTVTITNPTGCVITETVSITEPLVLSATLSQTNISCYGLTDGVATATVTGGSSPLNYSWLPFGGTTLTANNLSAGNYTFNVSDGNGCALNQTITITEPGIFSASINANNTSICEQLEDTISSTIVGGTAPYLYNWIELPSSTVSTNPNYTYTTSVGTHSYNLSVTDNNGCVALSNTVSVLVNPSSNFSGVVTTNTTSPVLVAGRVVLYKYLPFYTKFDSVAGQNLGAAGDFLFNSFTAGKYIIKAIPSSSALQITYGDTAVNWKTAVQINHGCAVNDVQNISVKPLAVLTGTGTGSLSGEIREGDGFGERMGNFSAKPSAPGTPIGGIIVKGGKNPGGQMFVQTVTSGDFGPGAKGTYTLSGLPPNGPGESYFILVDIPGLDTNNTYHRIIDLTNNNYQGLDFVVDSAKINPIPFNVVSVNDISAIENEIKVFPNPASNILSIQYNLKANALVKIELFDMLGKSVKMLLPETQQSIEFHKKSWQIDNLGAGLYFIKMTINGSESTIKLSVTH